MIKKIVVLTFLLFFHLEVQAALKVSPTMIELSSKNAKGNYITSSFVVQANKDEIARFKIYPEFFKITSEGRMDMIPKTDDKRSLINNIKFVPSEFTLQNGRSQKVRLTITNYNKMPDGELRAVLFVEDIKPREVNLANRYQNVSTKLLVKTRVGIPVYLENGRVVKKAEIENLSIQKQGKKLLCDIRVHSNGNSKIRYYGKAQIVQNKELIGEYKINKNVVGDNNYLIAKEIIPINDIKNNGEYKLRIILNYKDENDKNKNLIKETKFIVDDIEKSI